MDFFTYKNKVNKKCGFELFENGKRCLCLHEAIGQAGRGDKATPLCHEHFEYARGISGKSKYQVKEIKG